MFKLTTLPSFVRSPETQADARQWVARLDWLSVAVFVAPLLLATPVEIEQKVNQGQSQQLERAAVSGQWIGRRVDQPQQRDRLSAMMQREGAHAVTRVGVAQFCRQRNRAVGGQPALHCFGHQHPLQERLLIAIQ